MDALQPHQPRRFMSQDQQQAQQETHQQGPPWYSSSYPSTGAQHQPYPNPLPPPLPPHQPTLPPPHHQNYLHPQQQQQQQWAHQQLPDQLHQWQPSPAMVGMPPPPAPGTAPYHHSHSPVPPYPPPTRFTHPHHVPPPPSHPSALPHTYPQPNQTWGNSSWHQHQGWEYPDRNIPYNNEEDWAARARAWASANSATENRHVQSQYAPVGRMEVPNHVYHDQSQQAIGTPFTDSSVTNLQRRVNHLQESSSLNSASSSYFTNLHTSYESTVASPPQGSLGSNTSVYEQEVPSSYSSVPGIKDAGDQNDRLHMPLPLHVTSVPEGVLHSQSVLPVRSFSMEEPCFTYGSQSTELSADASDQPLDFERRSFDPNLHQKTSYGHAEPLGPIVAIDHIAAAPSIHSWTPPVAKGVAFPQIPPAPSGPQFDSSLVSPSLSGHAGAVFGRLPGSSFQPSASFGLGSEPSFHHAAAFPADANGPFNLSERPKKASVPNWLIEEISKTKPVIASSSNNIQPTENSFHSIGAEDADKSLKKGDQGDSKSIDSTRSTEDDEDDEGEVEAARTAAMNQEIKRLLTEVLLKVTDELFEEIATKVLHEDDQAVEVENGAVANHKVSPSPPAVKTPKASAKVLVPGIVNSAKANVRTNSILSSSGGDILGLANYASDDEYEETRSSNLLSPGVTDDASHQSKSNYKPSENVPEALQKRSSPKEVEEPSGGLLEMESENGRAGCNGVLQNASTRDDGMSSTRKNASPGVGYKDDHENAPRFISGFHDDLISVDVGKTNESLESTNALQPKEPVEGNPGLEPESAHGQANNEKLMIFNCQEKEASSKSNKHQDKKSAVSKESIKDAEASMVKDNREGACDPKGWKDKDRKMEKDGLSTLKQRYKDQPRILEDRDRTKDKVDERDNVMQRSKEQGVKQGKYVREYESRKNIHHGNAMDDLKVSGKDKRARTKEDDDRKREQALDGRADISGRVRRDLDKSRQSSSPSFKGRNSKVNSLSGHSGGSSDEVSDHSKKRKLQPKEHSLSPSPTRSRKRQVSRSPHSKHSQRRHSPYSSTEKRRRSRSRSPVHRRRSEHRR